MGYALDVALLATTVYLFASNPLVADNRAHGFAAVKALPFGAPGSNATATTLSPVASFFVGSNLGAYAASNPLQAAFHDTDAWINSLCLPAAVRTALPHIAAVWLRNLLLGWALYYIVGIVWSVWIYWAFGAHFFPDAEDKPSWESMFIQMRVSVECGRRGWEAMAGGWRAHRLVGDPCGGSCTSTTSGQRAAVPAAHPPSHPISARSDAPDAGEPEPAAA